MKASPLNHTTGDRSPGGHPRAGRARRVGPRRGHRGRRVRHGCRDRRGQVRLGSPGKTRLVLGHESLGRWWIQAEAGLQKGDLVVGIVRRPDPCPAQLRGGEWTCAATGSTPSAASRRSTASCRSAGGSSPIRREGRRSLGLLGVLLERRPLSRRRGAVLAVGQRAFWCRNRARDRCGTDRSPRRLIGKLQGLRSRARPRRIGAKPDSCAPWGRPTTADRRRCRLPARRDRRMHRRRQVIGTRSRPWQRAGRVSDGRRQRRTHRRAQHGRRGVQRRPAEQRRRGKRERQQAALYRAGRVLARADHGWLARLVSRCEPPAEFEHALARQPDDIKVVIQFAEA